MESHSGLLSLIRPAVIVLHVSDSDRDDVEHVRDLPTDICSHTMLIRLHSELVVVTGATGFIGAHVVDELLRRGLRVRAVARSKAKAEQMLRDRPQHRERLEFAFIEDLTDPDGFDDAVKGADAIVHCASVRAFIAILVFAGTYASRSPSLSTFPTTRRT